MKTFNFAYNKIIVLLIAVLTCSAMVVFSQSNQQNSASSKGFRPRTLLQKPAHATVLSGDDRRHIQVKFLDDFDMEIGKESGSPKELSGQHLKSAKAQSVLRKIADKKGKWMPMVTISKDKMKELRTNAEKSLNRGIANLSNYYILTVPDGVSAEEWMDELNSLAEVEIATPLPLISSPQSTSTIPNYEDNQGYLNPAPEGIDAKYAWGIDGGTGENVTIGHIEGGWIEHIDLPNPISKNCSTSDCIQMLIPAGYEQSETNPDHGTSVLGEMVSLRNDWGTTGASYGATAKVAPFYLRPTGTSNPFNATAMVIMNLINPAVDGHLVAGDVILVEVAINGPLPPPRGRSHSYVPAEWDYAIYTAIQIVVANGIHVVEVGANDEQNLDHPAFSTGHNGHYPFLPENNSGAIIVGGGAVEGGSGPARSWFFTTYGSRVDLQGWGEMIWTVSGDDGYPCDFGGTSGAAPIVASAVANLESIYEERNKGATMSPADMRDVLVKTGTPQGGTDPDLHHIGPLPNLRAAIKSVTGYEGIKVGVILIEIKDHKHYTTDDPATPEIKEGDRPYGYLTSDFEKMLFSTTDYSKPTPEGDWYDPDSTLGKHPEGEKIFGSFRDYWDQVSCHKVQITGKVLNPLDPEVVDPENPLTHVPKWLTSDLNWEDYKDLPDPQTPNELVLANEAISKAVAAKWISLKGGDPNYYDKYIIIFSSNAIREGVIGVKASTIYGEFIQIYERTGWKLDRYSVTKRQNDGEDEDNYDEYVFCHVGIPLHEFGHILGLFDMYVSDDKKGNTWKNRNDPLTYTLMSWGMYNGPFGKGECPATLSPYERISLGWVTPPTLIDDNTTGLVLNYNYENPQYYKIYPPNAPHNGAVREHYIIESRGRDKFDQYLPNNYSEFENQNGRLLIWHNDILNENGTYPIDRIYYRTAIEPADGIWDSTSFSSDFFPCATAPQDFDGVLGHPLLVNERPGNFALNGIHRDGDNTSIDAIVFTNPLITSDITTNTTWNGNVIVGANIKILSNSTLTISPGVKIFFNDNCGIEVTPGSKITAIGTSTDSIGFVRLNPSNHWDKILLKGNDNQFAYCVFDGGVSNVEIRSKGNTFTYCEFKNAQRGIYADFAYGMYYEPSTFTLDNCIVKECTTGVYLHGSNPVIKNTAIKNNIGEGLYADLSTIQYFTNNAIYNNGSNGIVVMPFSSINLGNGMKYHEVYPGLEVPSLGVGLNQVIGNCTANESKYQIYTEGLYAQIRLGDLDELTSKLSQGYNKISSTTGKYICNYASSLYTDNLVAIPIEAEMNYWGEDGDVSGDNFTGGPINYSWELDDDPFEGSSLPKMASGIASNSKAVNVLSEAMVEKLSESQTDNCQKQFIVDLKNKILSVRGMLAELAGSKEQARLVHRLNVLNALDVDNKTGEGSAIEALLAERRARLSSSEKMELDDRIACETALLEEIGDGLRKGAITEVRSLIDNYGGYIENRENKRALLFAEISVSQAEGNYMKAWEILQTLKTIKPEEILQKKYIATPYDALEAVLKSNAKAAGVVLAEGSAEAINQQLPKQISLLQNYPNPFNPTTVMSYQIPITSYVSLKVYDMLGRVVAILQDGMKEAGYYSVTFSAAGGSASGGDASRLSSGVYFSRLTVKPAEGNAVVMVKKMLLMK